MKFRFFILLFLVLIGAFYWFGGYYPSKVYFYKFGTTTPISSDFIELFYDPNCDVSPCEARKMIYSGYTGEDGSIKIAFKHAKNVNRYASTNVGDDSFEYWVKSEKHIRPYYKPPYNDSRYRESNIIYLIEK